MFAVFEGLKHHNRFYSTLREGETDEQACKLDTGKTAYKILFKSESDTECQDFLFGKNNEIVNFDEEQRKQLLHVLEQFSLGAEPANIRSMLRNGQNIFHLEKEDKMFLAAAIKAYCECNNPSEEDTVALMKDLDLKQLMFRLILP
jgi:hypothetical protein